jgi:hypothetical protein
MKGDTNPDGVAVDVLLDGAVVIAHTAFDSEAHREHRGSPEPAEDVQLSRADRLQISQQQEQPRRASVLSRKEAPNDWTPWDRDEQGGEIIQKMADPLSQHRSLSTDWKPANIVEATASEAAPRRRPPSTAVHHKARSTIFAHASDPDLQAQRDAKCKASEGLAAMRRRREAQEARAEQRRRQAESQPTPAEVEAEEQRRGRDEMTWSVLDSLSELTEDLHEGCIDSEQHLARTRELCSHLFSPPPLSTLELARPDGAPPDWAAQQWAAYAAKRPSADDVMLTARGDIFQRGQRGSNHDSGEDDRGRDSEISRVTLRAAAPHGAADEFCCTAVRYFIPVTLRAPCCHSSPCG